MDKIRGNKKIARILPLNFTAIAVAAFLGFAGSVPAQAGGDVELAPPIDQWSGLSAWIGLGATDIDRSLWADFDRKDKLIKKKCSSYGHKHSSFYDCAEYHHVDQYTKYKTMHHELHAEDSDWEWFGTAGIGYDRKIHDRIYLGIFADYDFYQDAEDKFSISKSYSRRRGKNIEVFSANGDLEIDGVINVGGRLGVLLRPDLMVYALAAWSQMRVDGNIQFNAKDPFGRYVGWYGGSAMPTNLTLKLDEELDGYILGVGTKWMIRDGVSLGFEYRYGDYDGSSSSVSKKLHSSGEKGYGCNYSGCYKWKQHERWIEEAAKSVIDIDETHSVRAVLTLHMGTPHHREDGPLK